MKNLIHLYLIPALLVGIIQTHKADFSKAIAEVNIFGKAKVQNIILKRVGIYADEIEFNFVKPNLDTIKHKFKESELLLIIYKK